MSGCEAANDAQLTALGSPLASLSEALAVVRELGFDELQDLSSLEATTLENAIDYMAFMSARSPETTPTLRKIVPRPQASPVDASHPREGSTGEKKRRRSKREELLRLRSMVTQLETTLEELQQREIRMDSVSSDALVIRRAWEDMAARQRERRMGAEEENARLRERLEDQIRVVKEVERLLEHLANNESTFTVSMDVCPRASQCRSPLAQITIMNELQRTLIPMYNQVDAVMSTYCSHVSPCRQSRDTRLLIHSKVGLTMQIVESRVLPFSVKATADALWTVSVCHEYQTVCRETKKVDIHAATPDMMSKSFEGMLVVPQESAEVHVKIALQRFNEPNRVILVHHILNDPKSIAGKQVCGAMMRHQSWTVLEQGPHDSTLMRVYHTATPEVYEPMSDIQSTLNTLVNFVLLVVQAHLDLDLRQLEDLLLCSNSTFNM